MKGCERISCRLVTGSEFRGITILISKKNTGNVTCITVGCEWSLSRWMWLGLFLFIFGRLASTHFSQENTNTNLKHHQCFKIHQTYVQYLQKIWLTCSPQKVDCMAWWWLSWIIAESNLVISRILNSWHSNGVRGEYVVKEDFQIQLHSHLRYDHPKSYLRIH